MIELTVGPMAAPLYVQLKRQGLAVEGDIEANISESMRQLRSLHAQGIIDDVSLRKAKRRIQSILAEKTKPINPA